MMAIYNAITAFTNFIWGLPILVILVGGGLFITIRLGFFQFTKFPYIMKQTFGKMFAKTEKEEGALSPFEAACSALASSIGAANIVGVPTAIALGGPGAVFWMWMTALIGCATKFSEVSLGIKYREKNEVGDWVGGPAYYLRHAFPGNLGKFIAAFASAALMLEIVPSVATQSLSVCSSVAELGINKTITAVVMLAVVVLVVCGGIQRIGQITSKLVPLMALLYATCVIIILVKNASGIPAAFGAIFSSAFTGHAAVGGFAGAAVTATIRWGAARGCYSNEAGMGEAAYAHATAHTDHPARQGFWGVFEVFVDTIIVCTLTALMVLTSGIWNAEGVAPDQMPVKIFASNFGTIGSVILSVCIVLFVLSTIIVIIFYCEKNAEALFGHKFSLVMRVACFAAIIYGAYADVSNLYMWLDFLLMGMVIPNMIGLCILSGEVKEMKDDFFNNKELVNK